MKRVGIVGHFGNGLNLLNGQTIKTKIVSAELIKKYGKNDVLEIDTHGGIKSYLKLPFMLLFALVMCRNVVILPAQNGLRVIAPLLVFLNVLFRRRLHYVVIGGWMPNLIRKRFLLQSCLRRIDHIYVETSVMKKTLERMNFSNVSIMYNCKKLNIISCDEIENFYTNTVKFCTFSRVMKQKGIEHAVVALERLNQKFGEEKFLLDIYGPISPDEKEWFACIQQNFPKNIRYQGEVPFDKSVDVLKKYSILIFPTLFRTEGIPGTIIDAYAAGIPVVASCWNSFDDIVDEGETGWGYTFGSLEALYSVLESVVLSNYDEQTMKRNCIKKAKVFLPETAMNVMMCHLI